MARGKEVDRQMVDLVLSMKAHNEKLTTEQIGTVVQCDPTTAGMIIRQYLDGRTDDHEALFIGRIGEPRAHAWISRDNEARGEIEMNADEVEFLSSAGNGRADPSDEDAPPAAARDEQTGMEVTEPEELPF